MTSRWMALVATTLIAAGGFALDVSARGPEPDDARAAAAGMEQTAPTLAAAAFPNAPDGVDPMTTGPVSSAFKARQEALGCAEARWPNVPLDCYPN